MTETTLLYIIVSGIIALLLALFQYVYKTKRTLTNTILAGLRFVTWFSMFLLLVNPQFVSEVYYQEKPTLVVATDNSNSIQFLKQADTVQNLVEMLKNDSELNNKFTVDFYTFSSDISQNDNLTFTTKQTNLDKVFKSLKPIYKNSTAPTIVITDGNQTYGNDYFYAATSYKQPIYPIIVGDTTKHADLKISQLNVNKYAYLNNKFPVEIFVVYTGASSVTSEFKITAGNKTLYSERINFNETNNSKVIQATLKASQLGVFAYQATITPLEEEVNIQNNTKNFAIEVLDEQTNVAIVSNMPHPDIGALKKSIESNKQRKVTVLKPEAFVSDSETFELVIVYQPTAEFDAVYAKINANNQNRFTIAGLRTNWTFLNALNTNYKHDVVAQTEAYLPKKNANYAEFMMPDLNFESFPPLEGAFGNLRPQVPSETLLYKQIGSVATENPLLLTMDYNNRREAVLLGEGIWKWRAQSYLNANSFLNFDEFIGKVVQYLAATKKRERLSLNYQSFYDGSSNLELQAQYFNKNYEFDNRETLSITITDTNTANTVTMPLVLQNNTFQADLSALAPSDYTFTVTANTSNLSKSGSFKILAFNIEQQFTNATTEKLERVATTSTGNLHTPATVSNLLTSLYNDNRYKTIEKTTKKTVSLIDWKYLLGLLVLALAAEWFYRKYKGLI
ncbi:VWA domain-containing protein [Bizionia sediminis]|uniref:VWA domain-containing protein n=1 Tax=Bizionia sediminis TaxID=1737064 RepID=A0ABW5KT57_9FLAO